MKAVAQLKTEMLNEGMHDYEGKNQEIQNRKFKSYFCLRFPAKRDVCAMSTQRPQPPAAPGC